MAEAVGGRTVAELGAVMTFRELVEWSAYLRLKNAPPQMSPEKMAFNAKILAAGSAIRGG